MTLHRLASVLAAAIWLVTATGCGDDAPRELAGVQRMPLPRVAGVTLPDVAHGGEAFDFVAPDGGLLIVYFGYTHCPDVCPTTLSDIRSALGKIDGDRAERVALAFATVDPDRDDADLVTGYVQSFVPDAAALRTNDAEELAAAADAFGAVYDVSTNDAGEIDVVHSGFTYVVDDDGHLLVTWPFGVPADDIAGDLDLLFDEQAA